MDAILNLYEQSHQLTQTYILLTGSLGIFTKGLLGILGINVHSLIFRNEFCQNDYGIFCLISNPSNQLFRKLYSITRYRKQVLI